MTTTTQARNFSDGTLTIQDGTTPTPKSLLVALDLGELEWDDDIKVEPIYNRQTIVGARQGKIQVVKFQFKVGFDYMSGDTAGSVPSLREALRGIGVAATQNWKGVDAANGSSYCTNLIYELASPIGGSDKAETLTFGKCFATSISPKEGEIETQATIKGFALTVTSVRH